MNTKKFIAFLGDTIVWWGLLYSDKLFIKILAGFILAVDFYIIFKEHKSNIRKND
jgi:hypothetical protein